MLLDQVIKQPLVTEKNTYHSSSGTYVFEVNIKSNKDEIKKAIESAFRVKVDSIRTSVCRGRAKRNRFGWGKTSYWKKAFVKLAAGEKISLFEGV